jgi:ATP-dependent DNA helicase DinG
MFVILSAAMPSRLLSAFPENVMVSRVPLDVAIARVARRLGGEGGAQAVAQANEAINVE